MKKSEKQLRENFISELNDKLKTPEDAKYIIDKYHFEGLYLEDLKFMANNHNFNINKTGFINSLKKYEHKNN